MHFDITLISGLLYIVLIDLVLSGDNALVIAMALKSLPKRQRRKGLIFGAGGAVFVRVIVTFFASQLVQTTFIRLIGGLLITWIAFKLLIEQKTDDNAEETEHSLWSAVRTMVIADITMATDNMLAVAGASHGNISLILFGLALSIPLIMFTSNLLSQIMDRYPVVVLLGGAVLGRVGGEMVITDRLVTAAINPTAFTQYATELTFAVGVILASKSYLRVKSLRAEKILVIK